MKRKKKTIKRKTMYVCMYTTLVIYIYNSDSILFKCEKIFYI